MTYSLIKIWSQLLFIVLFPFYLLGQPKDSAYLSQRKILENGDAKQQATALLNIADHWQSVNIDSAINFCYQSIELANSLELKKELGLSYKQLCVFYRQKNEIDSIIKYGSLALKDQYAPFLSQKDLGYLYIIVAFNLKRKPEWSKAYSYLTEFLEKSNALPTDKVSANLQLAGIMSNLGDYDMALEYVERSRSFAPDDDPKLNYLINYSMVEACVHSEKFDTAKIYSDKILAFSAEDKGSKDFVSDRLSHANILLNQENYSDALALIQLIEQEDLSRMDIVRIGCHIVKGVCYSKLDQFEKGVDYLLKAEDLSKQKGATYNLKYIYENLAAAYSELNDYKKSAHYYYEYIEFLDQENREESNKAISLVEIERVKQEKDKTIQALTYKKLEQENRFAQFMWLGLVLGLITLGGIVTYYWYNKSQASKLEEEISRNKLQALRSNMNPHFMFNSLNTLQNFILKSEKYRAYNFITNFSKLMRSILDNANTLHASLATEIGLIENYLELEQIRFENSFEFSLQVDESLDIDQYNVPSMIVQPYAENAIIHGLSNKNGAKLLEVSFKKKTADYLECVITDNGIGRKAAAAIKAKNGDMHLSMATPNSIKRMEILRKMGYENANISIEDLVAVDGTSAGTKVIILLPILPVSL